MNLNLTSAHIVQTLRSTYRNAVLQICLHRSLLLCLAVTSACTQLEDLTPPPPIAPPAPKAINLGKVYSWVAWASQGSYAGVIRGIFPSAIQQGWPVLTMPHPEGFDFITTTKNLKPDGIVLWLPFGHDDAPHVQDDFDLSAYSEAKKDSQLDRITDVDSFVKTWESIFLATGVKEFIIYTGRLGLRTDIWAGLSRSDSFALAYENLAPYFQLAQVLRARGVSLRIVIDNTASRPADDLNLTMIFPMIRSLGIDIGGEAWPYLGYIMAPDPNYMTIADENLIAHFDPSYEMPRSEIRGPILPFIIDNMTDQNDDPVNQSVDERLSRVACAFKVFENVAVEYWRHDFTSADIRQRADELPSTCARARFSPLAIQ